MNPRDRRREERRRKGGGVFSEQAQCQWKLTREPNNSLRLTMPVSRVASRPWESSALYRVSPIKGDPFSLSWLDGRVIEHERMAVYTSSLQDIMGRATSDKSISLLNNNNARGACRGFATLLHPRVSIKARRDQSSLANTFQRFVERIFSSTPSAENGLFRRAIESRSSTNPRRRTG